ncbi:hypothetical protein GP486_005829 [Trichoglossum hirsutum]|uniref:Cytochrome P450 monooxygenase n=1 Tax=Trichoglossum hirsutum TaxID=265104 RepID=A0A9P8L8G5_9PEZI|nr:hypothetical protein GP486_005829 [Trichoglossum hirsutum]
MAGSERHQTVLGDCRLYLGPAFARPPAMKSVWLVLLLWGVTVITLVIRFLRNLQKARSSGIPYIVVPVSGYQVFWYLTHGLFLPLLRKLPQRWTDPWIEYAPSRPALRAREPVAQVASQRIAFPKDTQFYKVIELFDRNIVSTEGDEWLRHRRITAKGLGDGVNRKAWKEALKGGRDALGKWLGSNGKIQELESDMMGLSLGVMWRAGFGMKRAETEIGPSKIPHRVSFKCAFEAISKRLFWVTMIPHWLLARSPIESHRTAAGAFGEFERYVKELVEEKTEMMAKGGDGEHMDVLGSFIQSVHRNPNRPNNSDKLAPATPTDTLTESELMADIYIFLFAGHEATASAMYYSFLFLALNPSVQRHLQSSLDELLSQRPPEEWNYDHDLPALLTGMAGAVMNESLRLMPPFMFVPKITPPRSRPPELTLDGKRMAIPDGCHVSIALPALHRNPNCWPTEAGVEDDLDRFRPERWLAIKGAAAAAAAAAASETDGGLYRPPRGAFAPFSDGPRSCVGRRFAQIEIVAILAAVFHTHSVELSVADFATDPDVARMPAAGTERQDVWEKAAARARERMPIGIEESGLGLISRDNRRMIGFRIVKRGEERFF